jgi:hypothetical protein
MIYKYELVTKIDENQEIALNFIQQIWGGVIFPTWRDSATEQAKMGNLPRWGYKLCTHLFTMYLWVLDDFSNKDEDSCQRWWAGLVY